MVSEKVVIIRISFNELSDSLRLPIPNDTGMLACPLTNDAFSLEENYSAASKNSSDTRLSST